MATRIYSRLYTLLSLLSPSFLKKKKKGKEERKKEKKRKENDDDDEEKFKPAFRGERLLRI